MIFVCAVILLMIAILYQEMKEGFQSSQNCQVSNTIETNTENITTLQTDIATIQQMIQDISNNVGSLSTQVTGMAQSQSSLIQGAQPANITGT